MSLENERGKCQLTSCENRMSIKDRVLEILASEYILTITILTNGEPTAEICCSGCVSPKSYDTSGHWMVSILHTQVDIKYRGRLTEPDFRKNFFH